jgi:hypothetical protein
MSFRASRHAEKLTAELRPALSHAGLCADLTRDVSQTLEERSHTLSQHDGRTQEIEQLCATQLRTEAA